MINLATPIRKEHVREWRIRTVFVYQCSECKEEVRVRASAFRSGIAIPASGTIACPLCDTDLS